MKFLNLEFTVVKLLLLTHIQIILGEHLNGPSLFSDVLVSQVCDKYLEINYGKISRFH